MVGEPIQPVSGEWVVRFPLPSRVRCERDLHHDLDRDLAKDVATDDATDGFDSPHGSHLATNQNLYHHPSLYTDYVSFKKNV